ncbi:MAG: hypothetical protein ACKOCT_07665 [Alphaproteobacteria bacterium]
MAERRKGSEPKRAAVSSRRGHRLATAAIALAILATAGSYFWWAGWFEPRWSTAEPTGHHLPLYGRSLLDGHTWVRPAPPEMSKLPNPYDPEQYRAYFFVDLSYYRGFFYSYYGIVPVLTLFAPWTAITGAYLTEGFAAALLLSLAFAVAILLLRSAWLRHLPRAPGWAFALATLALAYGDLSLLFLMLPPHPRVVQASAWLWLLVALAASFAALHAERRGARWLALASLACGLMVGSRSSHLGACALLVPIAWVLFRGQPARGVAPVALGRVIAALLPLVAIGLALAWFNQVRFDSPFEFGVRYWLDGASRPGLRFFSLDPLPDNVFGHLFRMPAIEPDFPFLSWSDESLGALLLLPFTWLALLVPVGWRAQGARDRTPFGAFALAVALVPVPILLAISLLPVHFVRHEADFVLPLTWLASLGLLSAAHAWHDRPSARRLLAVVATVLVAISVATTVFHAMGDWNHPEIPWLESLASATVRVLAWLRGAAVGSP